jgi:hypothetical protein
MSDLKFAAKLALEALKANYELINGRGNHFGLEGAMDGYYSGCFDVKGTNKKTEESIKALEEALAKQEQGEPVAWINWCAATGKQSVSFECESELASQPLYVGITQITQDRYSNRKPLTDEQIEKMRHLIDWTAHWSYGKFARAIEAAHGIKEKNT